MFRPLHATVINLTIAVLLILFNTPASAEVKNEQKVKAAIVYKLLRYISWPEEAVVSNTINLCVDQNDPFYSAFSNINGRLVHKRKIVLMHQPPPKSTIECQIVFTSEDSRLDALIINAEMKKGVLTISDTMQFAERGGMINLVVKNNRVRFKINPHAAYRSELRINSSLLSLADLVETDRSDDNSAASLHADS
ncbi:MAG: YfiR family protein [Pseudomonadota bacterium]